MSKKKELKGKWYTGGMAGSVAVSCTHPLDLMKVRMQVAKKVGGPTASGAIASSIYEGEGIRGFYRGISAAIMRQMTYTTARVGVYDYLKYKFTPEGEKIGFITQCTIACAGGAAGVLAGNVFDLINIRMQSDFGFPPEQRRRYKHVFDGWYRMVQGEGVATMFTGLGPNIQRGILINLCQLVTYERCKDFLLESVKMEDSYGTHFYASMMSGIVTVSVTNPIDVVKSHVMSSPKGTYASSFACATSILKNDGPFAFLKGWVPSYTRLGPFSVIMFMSLEQIRRVPMFQLQDD